MNEPHEPDFATVLRAANAGHGWAFTHLYHSLERQVSGFVRARGVDDVDDVVNDVFLAAFAGIGGFSGDESGFRAWVFRITRNKLTDRVRRSRREHDRVSAAEFALATGPTSDGAIDRVVDDLVVHDLLSRLTEDQREVLFLRVIADLTAPQTAAVLDRPLSAVKALQRRAIRRLRAEISASVVSN